MMMQHDSAMLVVVAGTIALMTAVAVIVAALVVLVGTALVATLVSPTLILAAVIVTTLVALAVLTTLAIPSALLVTALIPASLLILIGLPILRALVAPAIALRACACGYRANGNQARCYDRNAVHECSFVRGFDRCDDYSSDGSAFLNERSRGPGLCRTP